jgi:hypothetical protein
VSYSSTEQRRSLTPQGNIRYTLKSPEVQRILFSNRRVLPIVEATATPQAVSSHRNNR